MCDLQLESLFAPLFFAGKTKTMIGSSTSTSTLGVIPCAITWLYRAVNEQKQKTGTRFSVRVSAVEITTASPQQMKDLLADYASGEFVFHVIITLMRC